MRGSSKRIPGRQTTTLSMSATCGFRGVAGHTCSKAIAALHLQEVVENQPAGRYWTFQWVETGIYAGLALLATGACWYR